MDVSFNQIAGLGALCFLEQVFYSTHMLDLVLVATHSLSLSCHPAHHPPTNCRVSPPLCMDTCMCGGGGSIDLTIRTAVLRNAWMDRLQWV